jgi:hypothetical protein
MKDKRLKDFNLIFNYLFMICKHDPRVYNLKQWIASLDCEVMNCREQLVASHCARLCTKTEQEVCNVLQQMLPLRAYYNVQ